MYERKMKKWKYQNTCTEQNIKIFKKDKKCPFICKTICVLQRKASHCQWNLGNFHFTYIILPKENEKIRRGKCPQCFVQDTASSSSVCGPLWSLKSNSSSLFSWNVCLQAQTKGSLIISLRNFTYEFLHAGVSPIQSKRAILKSTFKTE